jgi:hypothetical protein
LLTFQVTVFQLYIKYEKKFNNVKNKLYRNERGMGQQGATTLDCPWKRKGDLGRDNNFTTILVFCNGYNAHTFLEIYKRDLLTYREHVTLSNTLPTGVHGQDFRIKSRGDLSN